MTDAGRKPLDHLLAFLFTNSFGLTVRLANHSKNSHRFLQKFRPTKANRRYPWRRQQNGNLTPIKSSAREALVACHENHVTAALEPVDQEAIDDAVDAIWRAMADAKADMAQQEAIDAIKHALMLS